MKQSILFILFLITTSFQAQNNEEIRTVIEEDSSKVNSVFFDDGILARKTWYGNDSKIDSLKTFHKSGDLNEWFSHDEHGRFLKGKQFNPKGELLTTWDFKDGVLAQRLDYKLEYNTKNKANIQAAHTKIKEYNYALLKDPNNFGAIYLRARARYMLNNYTLALMDFKWIEKRMIAMNKAKNTTGPNKSLAAVYDYIASIYSSFEMENYTVHYKIKAIHASPNESRLYYNLGAYLTTINAHQLGISYLNKAIEMVPKHGFAHWLLGIAYSDLGENEKAMKNINIAFQHEDGIYRRSTGRAERDLRTTRGLLYHRLGDSKKGIADLEEALKINKDNSFALRNLGVIYYDLGKYVKACELLTKSKNLAYEKVHDKDDLQAYLDNACNNKKEDLILATSVQKPFIYPNPTKDFAYIKNFDFENFNFQIYDFESKLIKQGIAENKSVDFSGLPSGLYILRVRANNETHTFKVVKD